MKVSEGGAIGNYTANEQGKQTFVVCVIPTVNACLTVWTWLFTCRVPDSS